MSTDIPRSDSFEVVIAGGGVAAIEAALALRDLAADRITLSLIAPNEELRYRPMAVREPFAYAAADRYPLDKIVGNIGARLVKDSFAWPDVKARVAYTESGDELRYDALVICLGARAQARYEAVITVDDRRLDELLHGLIQDIEEGYVRHVAFVAPPRMAWPLPLYELALMSATRAYDMNIELAVTLLTPEEAPLGVFGEGASRGVLELLGERRVEVIASARCEVPQSGRIVVKPGHRELAAGRPGASPGQRVLTVDRIVALPELYGPAVRGLPSALNGFIPVDPHCQVRGVERVFAAGDATDFAIKHGGIAAQQADAAATTIASLAGAPVRPQAFHPVIHGILLTGAAPRYLTAHVTGGHGFSSQFSEEPTWSPPTKIAAKYLAPYLEELKR